METRHLYPSLCHIRFAVPVIYTWSDHFFYVLSISFIISMPLLFVAYFILIQYCQSKSHTEHYTSDSTNNIRFWYTCIYIVSDEKELSHCFMGQTTSFFTLSSSLSLFLPRTLSLGQLPILPLNYQWIHGAIWETNLVGGRRSLSTLSEKESE